MIEAAGKAVLCEKPVDLDLERARTCRANAARSGRPVMIGFNRRVDPSFAALKELAESFTLAARQPLVKGCAVGRSLFGNAARSWFTGTITDSEAVAEMAENYARLCRTWDTARAQAMEKDVR